MGQGLLLGFPLTDALRINLTSERPSRGASKLLGKKGIMTEQKRPKKPRSDCRDEQEYRVQFTAEEAQEGALKASEILRKAGARKVKSNSFRVRTYPKQWYKQD